MRLLEWQFTLPRPKGKPRFSVRASKIANQDGVTSLQLHDKLTGTEKDKWGSSCAYGKVFGTTEGGEVLLLWDRKNGKRIYRQYGSHVCAPCDYEERADS